MENTTLPIETLAKIQRILAIKGCALTKEELIAMEVKKMVKNAKKINSKSNNAKWESRANIENNVYSRSIAEINRENLEKNLPSSMRK
jgi:hypothetical protein